MRELAQWVFEAGPGEAISIRIVPRESEARYVGVWLDDNLLQADANPYSYPYLIYSFNIRRPAWQSHIIKLECNFSLNAAPTASYDLWISGSLGSGEFLRTVRRDDLRDVDIVFTIAKPAPPPTAMDDKVPLSEDAGKAIAMVPDETGGGEEVPKIAPDRIVVISSKGCARELLAALGDALRTDESAGEGGTRDHRISADPVGMVISSDCAREFLMGLVTNLGSPATGLKGGKAGEWTGGQEATEKAGNSEPHGGGGIAEEHQGSAESEAPKESTDEQADAGPPDRADRFEAPPPFLIRRPAITTEGSDRGPGAKADADSSDRKKHWKRGKPPLKSYDPGDTARSGQLDPTTGGKGVAGEPTLKPKRRGKQKPVVNVGFVTESHLGAPIESHKPLASGRLYYFSLWVGVPHGKSLEAAKPTPLPTEVPPGARLKVALFGYKGELEIKKGADVGELELQPDRSGRVIRAPSRPKRLGPGPGLLERRLFFPIVTPQRSGVYRLRCNIYYQQVLIQSRLVTARVMARPRVQNGSLRSVVDYTLSKSVSAAHLTGMQPARLSIMLNSNGNRTFGLRIFGESVKDDAAFDDHELQDLIDQARGELRMAAWGDREPWQQAKQYRYDDGRDFNRLKIDLIRLAKQGYAFYRHIVDRFTGGVKQTKALSALMQKPGPVQVALKESARHTLPAAMIYDYSLDDGWKDDQYKICQEFTAAFDRNKPLPESGCFKGDCPSRGDDRTVCPSGFWGYRHFIGMPLSIAGAPDAPTEVNWNGAPHLTLAVSTSPKLLLRADHEKAVRALRPGFKWDYADTRDATFKLLKESNPHLVYFYCHGGLARNKPYLKVGPDDGPVITESNLGEKEIEWDVPRPLVFINGCHTTALEPEQAIEFVSSFVRDARAAGVIGTEITVFESLARAFAEDCLRSFIVDGKSIGESIRGARLALLQAGNPLGLVYVPYVMTGLRLVGR